VNRASILRADLSNVSERKNAGWGTTAIGET